MEIPQYQGRSPSQKQERVGKDRKSRKAGYEGSLSGMKIPQYQGRNSSGKQGRERERERERERRKEETRVSEIWQERSVDFLFSLILYRGNRTYLCQQLYNHINFRAIIPHIISVRHTVKCPNLNKCIQKQNRGFRSRNITLTME